MLAMIRIRGIKDWIDWNIRGRIRMYISDRKGMNKMDEIDPYIQRVIASYPLPSNSILCPGRIDK